MNDVSMAFNTTSVLKPMKQGVISTFKSHDLRNTFRKDLAANDSDSSDVSGQSKLKSFQKGFTILAATENIRDSRNEVKIATLTRVWETLRPAFLADFEGFQAAVEEVTAHAVGKAELKVQAGPKRRLNCCHLMIKL